jgi:outer membrane protein assembly factor BamE (lipoprotein component of BamABCDE complex)
MDIGKMKKILLMAVACFLEACQPRINARGNVIVEEKFKNFAVGKTTMQDVLTQCGAPSLLRNNYLWIYVGARSEEKAFSDPKLNDKFVVRMEFDSNKILKSIEKIDAQPKDNDHMVMNEEVTGLINENQAKRQADVTLGKGQ